jgi:hypothetical protein
MPQAATLATLGLVATLCSAAAPAQPAPDKSRFSLTNPTPRALLREMSTDRPDKTESPYTVDAGRVQVEFDLLSLTTDRRREGPDVIRSRSLSVLPVNLKLGLTNRTDLQILVEPYVHQRERRAGSSDTVDGFGDVTLRLKRNLWGNDGGDTALALMPFVKLPTSSAGIGNDAVEFGIIVPLAIGVSDQVGIGLMTEIDMLQESDGRGYALTFVNSATIAFALTDRLGLYTEAFTERSTEAGAKWVTAGDLGLTYALSDDLQLDGGVNIGITEAADDLNLFLGISRRF